MKMYFLLCHGERGGEPVRIRAWVRAEDAKTARQRVEDDMVLQSVSGLALEACETTVRTDYFAPCPSLDAFERAARDGAAYLIAPR